MKSPILQISALQLEILEKISHQYTSSVQEVERSKLLLFIHKSHLSTLEASKRTGKSWTKVQRWRTRWVKNVSKLDIIEQKGAKKAIQHELEQSIRKLLKDSARAGTPSKFSAHTYCQILGVALEDPQLSGHPISEWSLRELTAEIHKRGIVSSISRSQVGAFLKSERYKATQDGRLDESKM